MTMVFGISTAKVSSLLYVVGLSALLAVALAQMDDATCKTSKRNCQLIGATALVSDTASDTEKCAKVKEAIKCLDDLDESCASDILVRNTFRQAELQLSSGPIECDLSAAIYPPVNDDCTNIQRECLNTYVDKMLLTDSTKLACDRCSRCQDLRNYIKCRMKREDCSSNDATFKQIVADEEKRLHNISRCVIPSLESTLNTADCGLATGQCLSTNDDTADELLCEKTLEAVTCVADLDCNSAVNNRIIQMQQTEKVMKLPNPCDISSKFSYESEAFPYATKPDTGCIKGLQKCLFTYVDSILAKDKNKTATEKGLCEELKSFICCHLVLKSCAELNKDALKKLLKDESERMRIGTCEVEVESPDPGLGVRITPSIMVISFVTMLVILLKPGK